ncbi:MAG TPA: ABC transporter C-terminal domain-containing protein, partial [Ktedonobacterales bacterium]
AGNYTTYRTRRAQAEFVAQAQAQVEARAATAATRAATAETVRRQVSLRTVERVEAEIASLEERIAEIEGELSAASAEANVDRINELAEQYEREKARLAQLYDEWQELAS